MVGIVENNQDMTIKIRKTAVSVDEHSPSTAERSITDPLREFGGQFYEGTNPSNLRFMDIFLALDSLADDIDREHERAIKDAIEEAEKNE